MIASIVALVIGGILAEAFALCRMAAVCDDYDEVHLHIRRS